MSSADTLYHIFLYCDSVSLLRSAMVARDWEYESSRDDVCGRGAGRGEAQVSEVQGM